MLGGPKALKHYRTLTGSCPIEEWLNTLDHRSRRLILRRMDRLRSAGHLGDFDSVGDGVIELIINSGPGFRVYVIPELNDRILLLFGGVKRDQRRDIQKAKEYAKDHRLRGGQSARFS